MKSVDILAVCNKAADSWGEVSSVTLRRAKNKLWPDQELVDTDDTLPKNNEILEAMARDEEFGG